MYWYRQLFVQLTTWAPPDGESALCPRRCVYARQSSLIVARGARATAVEAGEGSSGGAAETYAPTSDMLRPRETGILSTARGGPLENVVKSRWQRSSRDIA